MDEAQGNETRDRKAWLKNARRNGRVPRMTQAALAEQLDVCVARVAQYESSSTKWGAFPRLPFLRKVSEITGVALPEHWSDPQSRTWATPRSVGLQSQPPAANVAEEIHSIGALLASWRLAPQHAERNAQIFAQTYGTCGHAQATQHAAGLRFGLTRERARQIVDRLIERLKKTPVQSPQFDRLIAATRQLPILPMAEAESRLRDILGPDLRLEDARNFGAEVLGKPLPMVVSVIRDVSMREHEVFVPADQPMHLAEAINATKKLTRHLGAAQLSLAWSIVLHTIGVYAPLDEFRRLIEGLPGFEWLDKQRSWYWLGPHAAANRIVDRATEILAVAGNRNLDIEVIYGGIARWGRSGDGEIVEMGGVFPPVAVVRSILIAHPGFQCRQKDDFRLTKAVAPEAVLSDSALQVYQFLAKRKGLASRRELNQEFVSTQQMNQITLGVALTFHPAFRQIDRAVFAIRGWPIDPTRFSECVNHSKPSCNGSFMTIPTFDVAAEEGEGFIAWIFQLSPVASTNYCVTIPRVLRMQLNSGDEIVADASGVKLHVNADRLVGLVPLLRRMHIATNERIRIAIHPSERRLRITRLDPVGKVKE